MTTVENLTESTLVIRYSGFNELNFSYASTKTQDILRKICEMQLAFSLADLSDWNTIAPNNFTPSMKDSNDFKATRSYSTQLLLSAIQKAVRRKQTENAYYAARLLLTNRRKNFAGLLALSRRLPIIVCEDSFYHPLIGHCIWLMVALTDRRFCSLLEKKPLLDDPFDDRFIPSDLMLHFEQLLLTIVVESCCSNGVDSRPSAAPPTVFCCKKHQSDEFESEMTHRCTRDSSEQLLCLKSFSSQFISDMASCDFTQGRHGPLLASFFCLIRHAFGGMEGDRALLHDSVHRWYNRWKMQPDFWHSFIHKKLVHLDAQERPAQLVEQAKQFEQEELISYKLPREAVDFHVFRDSYFIIVKHEARLIGRDCSELDEQELKRLVWVHRSSLYDDCKTFICPLCYDDCVFTLPGNNLKQMERESTLSDFEKIEPILNAVSDRIATEPWFYKPQIKQFWLDNKRLEAERRRQKRKFGTLDPRQKSLEIFFKRAK